MYTEKRLVSYNKWFIRRQITSCYNDDCHNNNNGNNKNVGGNSKDDNDSDDDISMTMVVKMKWLRFVRIIILRIMMRRWLWR